MGNNIGFVKDFCCCFLEFVIFKLLLNILIKGVKVENLKFLNVKNYMNVIFVSCYKKKIF